MFRGEAYKYQYTLGSHLLVAPVFETQATSRGWKKGIFLPEGTWFDFWNGIRTVAPKNGRELAVPVTLATIPVLVRAGAIVPMYKGARSDDLQPKDYVELHLWPYGQSQFDLLEDDGETYRYRRGELAKTAISMKAGTRVLENVIINVGATVGTYYKMPRTRTIKFIVHTQSPPKGVTVNTAKVQYKYDARSHYGTVTFEVKNIPVTTALAVLISLDKTLAVPKTPSYQKPKVITIHYD